MTSTNNNTNYQESNSVILDLETLNTKFKTLLIEYQQAVLNYVNYLKEDTLQTNDPMVVVQGQSFFGTNIIENKSTTLQDCEASCSKTLSCSGATFNSDKKTCVLIEGEGNQVVSSSNDFAIIPKGKELLLVVQNINKQLTDVNQQLQTKTTIGKPLYDEQSQERQIKTNELKNQFNLLTEERNKINNLLNNYQTLDQEQTEGNLIINKNYSSFLLFGGIAIFVLILFFIISMPSSTKQIINNPLIQSGGGKLGKNAYYIIGGLTLMILFINFRNIFSQ